MNASLRAILARCGSKTAAMRYCEDMAQKYPHLRKEYMQHFSVLLNMKG